MSARGSYWVADQPLGLTTHNQDSGRVGFLGDWSLDTVYGAKLTGKAHQHETVL
jgi:hypothetical protein